MDDDIYRSGNEIAYLTAVAKKSLRQAIDIAEANAEQPWAIEWLEENIDGAWLQKSAVVKSAELGVHEALAEFDAKQALFEKENGIAPGRGVNAFVDTDAGQTAYRKYSLARNELVRTAPHGPVVVAKQSADKSALAALERGLTAFAKAQGITKNIWTDGLDAFKQTPEGAALKRAVDEE